MKKLVIPIIFLLLLSVIPVVGQSADYILFSENPLQHSNMQVTIIDLPAHDEYLLSWTNGADTNVTYAGEPVIIDVYVSNFLNLTEVVFVLSYEGAVLQTRALPVETEPPTEPSGGKINLDFIPEAFEFLLQNWYFIVIALLGLIGFWYIRRGY